MHATMSECFDVMISETVAERDEMEGAYAAFCSLRTGPSEAFIDIPL